ncbi:hypothetical protein [Streptomyces sp. 15-116A]|uniref:hypothetical protein n=1 Tax=Streptomyces sp. 15-116A TaxID=2259035 RepID=UPI0021B298D8|nr:hypothetical protein [Streptomyces sp. 15-116A]
MRKATPRATASRASNSADAIWQGPFADECTATLQQRKGTLNTMGGALLADATRWENQADELDRQAKEKDRSAAVAGGN